MMISTDLLIVESAIGWFVVGHSNMGPFSSREIALQLAQQLVTTLRMSGAPSQVYMLERQPRGDAVMSPDTADAAALVARNGNVAPAEGATLQRMSKTPLPIPDETATEPYFETAKA